MSPTELRAGLSLGALFALRMLGLFVILPVFAVHAPSLRGGDDLVLVGVALGAYGLTQAMLQIPYGMAADRYGRKRVILVGLLLFAAGSFVAALAQDIWLTIAGRVIQGTGAISAAVMALAADLTREEHRTKTMAFIGASIGLVFALSLVVGPELYRTIGMAGIFVLTGVLSLGGIAILYKVVPPEPVAHADQAPDMGRAALAAVLGNAELLRLNFGILALHMMQMAMFVVVPPLLVERAGLPVSAHWHVYLPVVLASFVLMIPPLLAAERHGRSRRLFLGSIALLVAVAGRAHLVGHRPCYHRRVAARILRRLQPARGGDPVARHPRRAAAGEGDGARGLQYDAGVRALRGRRARRPAGEALWRGGRVHGRRRPRACLGGGRSRDAHPADRVRPRRSERDRHDRIDEAPTRQWRTRKWPR